MAASAPGPLADFQTVFTNAKAGMEGLTEEDKQRIKRVIYDMSQGSAHFRNEQRKQAQLDEKVALLRDRASRVTPAELAGHQRSMDQKIVALLASADHTRTWIHVDMDAFFASVEELLNPALKDVPMAVGGIGMISTANYHARRFGVRSAMPGFIAKVLCPQLIFAKSNFNSYTEYSQKTRVIFARYDPSFQSGSLDEAYLDVTDYCARTGLSGAEVAEALRASVREETKLTCSCGVACNTMLAKICSDLHKPDGQYVLGNSREQVMAFINTLPVRKIPGIGRVTEQVLAALNVRCCRDVLDNAALLSAVMTPALLESTLSAALGLGETRHAPPASDAEPRRKGISCERTFKPISTKQELEATATHIVEHLCNDMASENIEGRTVTLKLKAATFEVRTRAVSLPKYASQPCDILPAVLKLLHAELPFNARLLGVRMSQLQKKGGVTGALSRYFRRLPSPQEKQPPQQQQQPQGPGQQQDGQQQPDQLQSVTAEEQGQQGTARQQVLRRQMPSGLLPAGPSAGDHLLQQHGQQAERSADLDKTENGASLCSSLQGSAHAQTHSNSWWHIGDDSRPGDDLDAAEWELSGGTGSGPVVNDLGMKPDGAASPTSSWRTDGDLSCHGEAARGWQGSAGNATQVADEGWEDANPSLNRWLRGGEPAHGPTDAQRQRLEAGASLSGLTSTVPGYRQDSGLVGHADVEGAQQQLAAHSCAEYLEQPSATGQPSWRASSSAAEGEARKAAGSGASGNGSSGAPDVQYWTCRACTFAGNLPQILRCTVCDTLKGCKYSEGSGAPGSSTASSGSRAGKQSRTTGAGPVGPAKRHKGKCEAAGGTLDRFLTKPG